MFSRRRAASNPASKQPPSASASLAATKAFLRDRDSNPTLSSAAAAAALRAHVAPPTRVGETVTKRMVRKGSTSSHGSGSIQGGGLRRQSSSGSMTERTFRAPSPSRSSPAHHDTPPVPSVPKEISNANGLHRRASSLDPTTRDTSPGPRGGGRGVSLDRGVTATPGRGQRVASLSQVPEAINFSRPISPQQNTSPRSPPVGRGQSGWFGGPVINPDVSFRGASKPRAKANHGVSAADLHNVQQNIQNAVDRPVKKTQTSHGVEGTRLATGSMRAKPSGSEVQPRRVQQAQLVRPKFPQSVDPNSPDAVYDPSTRSFIRKQDAMAQHRAFEDELNEPHQHFLEHHTIPEPIPQRVPQRQSAPVQPMHSSGPQQSHGRRTESPACHHQREEQHAPYVEASTETDDIEDQFSSSQPSQPQAEAVLARRQSEDLAPIDVHPPATTHASHEDQADEHPASPTFSKLPSNQDGPYPRLATPVTEADTTTHAGRVRGNAKATERNQSLSPPRYAHFAPVAVEFPNGVKHQPPPRSVSPVKSALKSSPSVSRRNSSPIANNGRVVSVGAPSEPSDTMSDDGQKKKKKNVRVSFDADSVIVGTSAYAEADTPTSPTGLSASKWSTASKEQDEDDFMKPRPVLPSFGSIRDKNRRRSQDDTPEKVTETVPSSMSTSIASIGEPLEASSDHALGGILTQDFANKKEIQPAFDEPLPPEVTSVEGTGYVSDSSESTFNEPDAHVIEEKVEFVQRKEDEGMELARSTPEPEPKTLTTDVENRTPTPAQAPAMDVPIISIQMPSPSPNEKPEPKFPSHFVPGGWDEEESDQEANVEKVSRVQPIVTISKPTETKEKISEPEPASQPQPDESSDESDSSSIYSDAYEDLSEAEDGGFGSIDAVVESPVVDVPSGLMFSKYADRSQNEHVKSGLQNVVHHDGTTAGAPSSSVAKNITQQHLEEPEAEEEHRGEPAVTKPTSSAPTVHQKPRAERKAPIESKASAQPKSNLKSSTQTPQPAQSSTQPRKSALKAAASQPAGPPGPQLRKSMRDTAAVIGSSEPQTMQKSMRSGTATSSTEPRMRKSMRTSEAIGTSTAPSGLGLAASRHSMPAVESKPPRGALQKKYIPAATVSNQRPKSMQATTTKPAIPTYDSDSDASVSSFQRSRPRPRQNDGGRYTMRASMRSGPAPTMRTAPKVQSINPSEPASPPPSSLRRTMRPSSPPEEPAGGLKYSKFSIRSLSPTGRFRSSKFASEEVPPVSVKTSAPKKQSNKIPTFGKHSKQIAVSTEASKSRFKSRFVDSSDEEDDRPQRFQSRFADSDDEDYELPANLAPVRGIPRKPGEEDGDSTDLDDEASDGEPSPLPVGKDVEKSGSSAINGATNGQNGYVQKNKTAAGLPTMEAGKKAKSKRGFFGLGKKKTSVLGSAVSEPDAPLNDIPMPPAHRNREPKQQLTPIDEDKGFEVPVPPAQSRSPKLQRRSQPPRDQADSEQWPLQPTPKIGQVQRPQSSDGVTTRRTSFRPTLSKRHSSHASQNSAMTAETEPVVGAQGQDVSFGRSGKKKKFQGLRRVFGLHD